MLVEKPARLGLRHNLLANHGPRKRCRLNRGTAKKFGEQRLAQLGILPLSKMPLPHRTAGQPERWDRSVVKFSYSDCFRSDDTNHETEGNGGLRKSEETPSRSLDARFSGVPIDSDAIKPTSSSLSSMGREVPQRHCLWGALLFSCANAAWGWSITETDVAQWRHRPSRVRRPPKHCIVPTLVGFVLNEDCLVGILLGGVAIAMKAGESIAQASVG